MLGIKQMNQHTAHASLIHVFPSFVFLFFSVFYVCSANIHFSSPLQNSIKISTISLNGIDKPFPEKKCFEQCLVPI